jgi:hypothetical protein
VVAAIIDSFRFIEPREPVVPPNEQLAPFTNSEDGYEVMLPDSWMGEDSGGEANLFLDYAGNPYPGVRRFGEAVDLDSPDGASGRPALTISGGGADGTVLVCHSSWCDEVVVGSLDELQEVLAETEGGCGSSVNGLLHSDTHLADLEARAMLRGSSGGCFVAESPGLYYIYAIDEGRPVILAFDQVTAQFSAGNARDSQQILASFRLIEPDEPVQPPEDPLELYTNAEDGYEVLLPASLALEVDEIRNSVGVPVAGVREFGQAPQQDGFPLGVPWQALTISIGEPDGSVFICQPGPCAEVSVESVEELKEELVAKQSAGCPGSRFDHFEIQLGDQPAFSMRKEKVGCMPFRGLITVYMIHEGRPVVLTWDHLVALPEVLTSFRFLTETSGI